VTRTPAHNVYLGLVVVVLGSAACSQPTGDPGEWIPWDSIQGELAPEVGPPPAQGLTRAGSPGPLRIVTYNVHGGRAVNALARAFHDDDALARADVILLQEVESHPEEGRSRAARLAASLGMGYVYAPERREGSGTHGLAILSPFPLENAQVKELPFVDLPLAGNRRIALAANVRVGDQVVHVIDLHLDTRLNITDRIVQLRPAVIDARRDCVVAGDFNTNPYLWAEGALPIAPLETVVDTDQAPLIDEYMLLLGFTAPTADFGTTQHLEFIESRLDAIYPRGHTAVGGQVERDIGLSDHWPIWLDLDVGVVP